MQSQKSAGAKTMEYNPATAPPAAPRTMELRPSDLARSQMLRLGGSITGAGVTQAIPALANTATRGAGFVMDGNLNQSAPSHATSVGVPGSATGGARAGLPQSVPFRQETAEDALASFNAEARRLMSRPKENLYGMTSGIITDALAKEKQRTAEDVRNRVDDKLAGRQGFYATPQQRQSGFFQRGMGPMAGDAAIMARQNQPLGDGGPAAAAARADQQRRRAEAEQIMASSGATPDGLTRYRPNQDLLDFVNSSRSAGDQINVMTPSEIQFNRHKMNMANNPAYAARVNQQRADRQEMLDNRREMVRARRAGALEAAGASQQMRNLMAGRGALAGQDGFNAMASLAAMQNPNQAFGDYGQAYMAQMAPNMLGMRLAADERMLDRRADLSRMNQYEDMRMRIISSGAPDMEKQRALQSLDSHIMSSGVMRGSGGGSPQPLSQIGRELGAEMASNHQASYIPPSGIPLPQVDPNDTTTPTVNRYASYMQSLRNDPAWQSLPPEQQAEFLKRVQTQYFPGIQRSDMEQRQQDLQVNPLSRLWNMGTGMFGLDPASRTRRQEQLDALNPYIPGSAPYREGQHVLTDEEKAAVGEMPDSRDRQMYERFLRMNGG